MQLTHSSYKFADSKYTNATALCSYLLENAQDILSNVPNEKTN